MMMSIGVCSFSRVMVIGSPLGPITCLDTSNDDRNRFHLMNLDLNLIRRWLGTILTKVPFRVKLI